MIVAVVQLWERENVELDWIKSTFSCAYIMQLFLQARLHIRLSIGQERESGLWQLTSLALDILNHCKLPVLMYHFRADDW